MDGPANTKTFLYIRLITSSLREGGQQETAHGDESYHHAAVLPHVVHTLLQQVEDPRRPVHTQRPTQRRGAPVGAGYIHHLPG